MKGLCVFLANIKPGFPIKPYGKCHLRERWEISRTVSDWLQSCWCQSSYQLTFQEIHCFTGCWPARCDCFQHKGQQAVLGTSVRLCLWLDLCQLVTQKELQSHFWRYMCIIYAIILMLKWIHCSFEEHAQENAWCELMVHSVIVTLLQKIIKILCLRYSTNDTTDTFACHLRLCNVFMRWPSGREKCILRDNKGFHISKYWIIM